MDTFDFAQLNTEISVRERSFLQATHYQQLLDAHDDAQVALILQGTPYHLSAADVTQHHQIEATLMSALAAEYETMRRMTPDADLVNVFALKYVYHNLKVLLKMRAIEQDLSELLIPIGPYPLAALQHLSLTLSSDQCAPIIVEEVQQTWSEYLDYQNTVAIDVGMDSAYFRHLRLIADETASSEVRAVILGMIDFFNAITAKRALDQAQPNSFMYQLMSRKGTLSAKEMIEVVRGDQLAQWFNQINPLPYDKQFDPYIAQMRDGTITALALEYLRDLYLARLVNQAQYDAVGPLAVLRYLYGKEMEVTNLRLILKGRANHLAKPQIQERMRPHYYGN